MAGLKKVVDNTNAANKATNAAKKAAKKAPAKAAAKAAPMKEAAFGKAPKGAAKKGKE